jgi:hypothetical protein
MHGCPPSFLSLGPTQQDTAQPKNVSSKKTDALTRNGFRASALGRCLFPCASLIFLVKSSFGSLKTKEMDQKKGGLLQRAMPPKPTEGSRIRPIASTYNVMITLVYPFSLVVQRTVAPPTRKGINMETSLPFGSENLWRKSGFKFPETTRLYSQREYAAPKIIPSAANVATKLFLWKAPTKMGNSPIKLLVPGELILAKVEEKEMVERFGMVLTEPP